jgi:hypothetical protein
MNKVKSWAQRAALTGTFAFLAVTANAQTDITGVMTSVSGYKDAAIVIGIAILLFVIGRKVVRRLV